jgi:HK97 gp10 family phage protein
LKVAIEEGSIIVEGQAATLAPVDTGLLRKSINHRIIDRKGYPVGQIGTNVEYAPFQEFGTSKMKPQPFLLPALNQKRAQVKEVIARRLKTAL